MRIATWNVNSVRQRLDLLLVWLKERAPDVVCLQEIKCVDEAFPREPIEALGYNIATHGQKTFNGVALLSKLPFEEVRPQLAGDPEDLHARFLEGVVSHGKGTVQQVVELTPQLRGRPEEGIGGALKLTIQKFYRVSGGSTQNRGVVSDVPLPSIWDGVEFVHAERRRTTERARTTTRSAADALGDACGGVLAQLDDYLTRDDVAADLGKDRRRLTGHRRGRTCGRSGEGECETEEQGGDVARHVDVRGSDDAMRDGRR